MEWLGSINGIFGMIIGILSTTLAAVIAVIRVYGKDREKADEQHREERTYMMDKYDTVSKATQDVVINNTVANQRLAESSGSLKEAIDRLIVVVDTKLESVKISELQTKIVELEDKAETQEIK